MKRFHRLLFFFYLIVCLAETGFAQPAHPEWPALRQGEKVICHLAYCLVYNEEHEQASWVAYELTAAETRKAFGRSDRFIEDPKIVTGSASAEDYAGSGFDRGHLAPAADMGWSAQAMEESFYFSNMSPQSPQCNRGIWKKGEEQVRDWARFYGKLLVVTGPVLSAGLPAIGPNKVSVPEYYYKALLNPDSTHPKAIAFLVPNKGNKADFSTFAVPIDSVEKITHLNFFPWLSKEQEKKLEASLCISCWDWDAKGIQDSTHRTGKLPAVSELNGQNSDFAAAFRCHGITKKGNRCKRKVKKAGSNCYQHGG